MLLTKNDKVTHCRKVLGVLFFLGVFLYLGAYTEYQVIFEQEELIVNNFSCMETVTHWSSMNLLKLAYK